MEHTRHLRKPGQHCPTRHDKPTHVHGRRSDTLTAEPTNTNRRHQSFKPAAGPQLHWIREGDRVHSRDRRALQSSHHVANANAQSKGKNVRTSSPEQPNVHEQHSLNFVFAQIKKAAEHPRVVQQLTAIPAPSRPRRSPPVRW